MSSIVLRESEWAEKMIDSRSIGKKPSETLRRVARYYLDCGYSKKDTRKKLDVFLLQCDSKVSLPKWADTLDNAVIKAAKYPSINIDHITISKPELDTIMELKGKQLRKLAFTLLCLAKYWVTVNPSCDGWVNNKDSEIMAMANINTSSKRQALLYGSLRESGLLQFSKKIDNTSVRVCYMQDGDTAMEISDFRNLGYQYMKYYGDPYFECVNCGVTTRYSDPANGRKQKYCKACANEIATQQRVNSVMRLRDEQYGYVKMSS